MEPNSSGVTSKPKARRATERRNRDALILSEAISLMANNGYADTSMQDLADRVGILKGSLYHYFGSKEELLFRILLDAHRQSAQANAELREQDLGPSERLLLTLRTVCRGYIDNTDRSRLYFAEGRQLTGDRLKTLRDLQRQWRDDLRALVDDVLESGESISTADPALLTQFAISGLNSFLTWLVPPIQSQFDDDELVETFVTALARGLGIQERYLPGSTT